MNKDVGIFSVQEGRPLTLTLSRRRMAAALFSLLPIAYLLPPYLHLAGIRINWYEVVFLAAFFLGWRRGGQGFVLAVVLLCYATLLSNSLAVVLLDTPFNLYNFSLIKYSVSYIGAIQLGLHLPALQLQRRNRLALASFCCLLGMVLAAVYSWDIRLAIRHLYGVDESTLNIRFRLIGSNPYVLSSITIILYFFASRGRSFSTRALLFSLGLIPIFFARQRAGMILLPTFFLISEFNFRKSRVLGFSLLVLAFLACSTQIVKRDVLFKNMSGFLFHAVQRAADKRMNIIRNAVKDFSEYPISGTGYRSRRGSQGVRVVHAHNQYIGFVSEHGMLGAIALLLFIAILLRKMFSFRRMARIFSFDQSLQSEALVFSGIVIVYLIAMLGWQAFYVVHFTSFFFLILGYMIAELNRRKATSAYRDMAGTRSRNVRDSSRGRDHG